MQSIRNIPLFGWLATVWFCGWLGVYGWHLGTGRMPSRVSYTLFNVFDLYWYGLILILAILIAGLCVAHLVEKRARQIWRQNMSAAERQLPLAALRLPPSLHRKIEKRYQTVGETVYVAVQEPRKLKLNSIEQHQLLDAIATYTTIEPSWLMSDRGHAAGPWWAWQSEHIWLALSWMGILGAVGARLYAFWLPAAHVVAIPAARSINVVELLLRLIDFQRGGLGLWGAVAGGVVGWAIYAWRYRLPIWEWADLIGISFVLGIAIGRWANFINQDLYGRPTSLPWAIAIEPFHRLEAYLHIEAFHPLFLYASLWNLIIFLLLYSLWNKRPNYFRPGGWLAAAMALHAFGRVWIDALRLNQINIAQWTEWGVSPIGSWPAAVLVAMIVTLLAGIAAYWRKS